MGVGGLENWMIFMDVVVCVSSPTRGGEGGGRGLYEFWKFGIS